jgi:hypothetical protein
MYVVFVFQPFFPFVFIILKNNKKKICKNYVWIILKRENRI